MSRRVLGLMAGVALAACQPPAKPCSTMADCGAGAQCIDSVCVETTGGAGGRAGGTAGGSAGGTSGGFAGGMAGGMAGGTSGGMAGGMAGGTAGGTGGGTAGGTGGGAAGGSAGGMGGGTVDAGVPYCEAGRCAVWETCTATATGGTCASAGLVVTLVSPANDAGFGGPGPNGVTYRATVTPPAVGVGTAMGLSVQKVSGPGTVPGGLTLTGVDAGLFELATTLTGGMEGRYRLQAGWDGGPVSAPIDIHVDRTAPRATSVAVSGVPSRPGVWWLQPNVFRRDERVHVLVAWDEVVVDGGLTVSGVTTVSAMRSQTAAMEVSLADCAMAGLTACPASFCRCYRVDLSDPQLEAVSGSFGLTTTGADVLGNTPGMPYDGGSIPVTRVRWQQTVAGVTSAVEPALDETGNVYAGFVTGADAGAVASYRADGTQRWVRTAYGAVTAPVVWSAQANLGDGGVFVATRANQAAVRQLRAQDGLEASNSQCVLNFFYTARMASLGKTVVTAAENPTTQVVARLVDFENDGCSTTGSPVVQGRATLVASGGLDGGVAEVYFGGTANSSMSKTTTNAGATSWAGSIDTLGAPAFANSIALAGPVLFVSPSGATNAGVVAANRTTGFPLSAFTAGAALAWTMASVRGAGPWDVYFGTPAGTTSGDLYRTTFDAGMPVGTFTPNDQTAARVGAFDAVSNSFSPAHAPLVAGNSILTVSTQGDLSLLTPAGARQWNASGGVTAFGAVSVSPTLDVNRNGAGNKQCGRPGVLYVVSNTGTVTSFLVDAPGLDGTAAWPKFQHDPANSGNAAMSLQPWTCP